MARSSIGHRREQAASFIRHTAPSVLPLLLFGPILLGIALPWERGYQWSHSGWEAPAGRALSLVLFVAFSTCVVALAGQSRPAVLAALALSATAAIIVPVVFFLVEVGRHDSGIVDGFGKIRAGLGLVITVTGALMMSAYVVFELRR